MATYTREDFNFQNAMGVAISGGQIYICTQPANTVSLPPSPLATVYADPNGVSQLTQPLVTDGFGETFCYLAPGIYTFVYFSPSTGELVYVDQTIISTAAIGVNAEVPAGAVNGTNTTFTLADTPNPSNSLQLFVGGLFQLQGVSYTLVGNIITMTTAPHTGQQIAAIYNVPV